MGFVSKPTNASGDVFQILVVDDDRANAALLQELMGGLKRRYELHFVWDGFEALEFLRGKGRFEDAPCPHLILLDINMPRLGGLETLSMIKSDPALASIPVIMLSSSARPADVSRGYQSGACAYVQKSSDLERSMKFIQALEAFWMETALLPECAPTNERRSAFGTETDTASFAEQGQQGGSGMPFANMTAEANSRAMKDSAETLAAPARRSNCEEHDRLMKEFGDAVRDLLTLQEEQFRAIVDGDVECSRFDLLIHMANENKQKAKYAYLRHMEEHGCSYTNAKQTRA